uniref:Phosphomethylpyrimidine synthase n=1 Tax=Anthurium amnicola TaxID=1678845 RepID=A0A1D1ZDL0_9ARAE
MRHTLTVLACVLVVLACEVVEARRLQMHKFAVKTIKSEDGDIFDCVDVYKQPSLETLSSKNHTIPIFGSHPPTSNHDSTKKLQVQQQWQRSIRCPRGTIPIRRSHAKDYGKSLPTSPLQRNGDVERALAYASNHGPFHGVGAKIQSWEPKVEPNEYSMSYVTVMTASNPAAPSFGELDTTDFVRAGWMVHPIYFGDNTSRLFVQWSNDDGATTGCFNLDCDGFVQTSSNIALGASLHPLSVYNKTDEQYFITVNIYLDASQSRWCVSVQEEELGYWPVHKLFPQFINAPFVTWGGEVLNTWPGGQHTTTQMGNGHFAEEGRVLASTAFDLTVTSARDNASYVYAPGFFQDSPTCYDTDYYGMDPYYFIFGGPGGHNCSKAN